MEPEDPNIGGWKTYPTLAARATTRRDVADTAILNPAIAERRRQLRDACIVALFGGTRRIATILDEAEMMADLAYPRKV